jgi:hypothetical protein
MSTKDETINSSDSRRRLGRTSQRKDMFAARHHQRIPIGFDAMSYGISDGQREYTPKSGTLACSLQVKQDRQATPLEALRPLVVGALVIAEDLKYDDRGRVDAPVDGCQQVLSALAIHLSTHSHRCNCNPYSGGVWSVPVTQLPSWERHRFC